MSRTRPLVLASSSQYRRALLERLGLPFECVSPEIDETRHDHEAPETMALRLAEQKALAVAQRMPGALVIGSDQVAQLGTEVLGKPGNARTACDQLERASGREVEFLTALVVVDSDGQIQRHLDRTRVRFRQLSNLEITTYVARDQPLDCAGSFRSEGLGIALFEQVVSEDPTALVGLPLIALARMLRQSGINIL